MAKQEGTYAERLIAATLGVSPDRKTEVAAGMLGSALDGIRFSGMFGGENFRRVVPVEDLVNAVVDATEILVKIRAGR